MIRRAWGSVRPRQTMVLVAVLALASLAFWPSFAEGAASTFKSVVIRNTTTNPVPVVAASPDLRSGRLDVTGAGSEPVPAGVVLTDLVVWHMNANCEVRLHQGGEEAIRLAPTRDASDRVGSELHLTTGIPSTAEQPLTLRTGEGPFCPSRISAFWSGHER